jgi:hypothetical protein
LDGYRFKELGENKRGCRLNFTCKKDGINEGGEYDGVWDRPAGLEGARCIDQN